MKKIDFYKIPTCFSIRQSIKRMDAGGIGFCVCVDEKDKVIGVISDGDFRRGVLKGIKLDDPVTEIMNDDFVSLPKNHLKQEIEEIFSRTVVHNIPVIENGLLVDIITDEDFYGIRKKWTKEEKLNIPVVIMAGGKGTRLDPFTKILPKPLIPIDDKPLIEVIMDKFTNFGMTDFYISINHKGKMIRAYFEDHQSNYQIQYIEEEKPLGTAGALNFFKGKFDNPFFVSNCDVIIQDNYVSVLNFHKDGQYDMTLVGSMQHHTVPYGVCEIENGGKLRLIKEKPQYDFLVNTGMYIIEPKILSLIPPNENYDMTDLIGSVQAKGFKVGVYPVSEKSWIDVGQWEEYKKALNSFWL